MGRRKDSVGKGQDSTIRLTDIQFRNTEKSRNRFQRGPLKLLRYFLYLTGSYSLIDWFCTLFELNITPPVLVFSTLCLGSWYFLVFFNRKTKRVCIPLTLGLFIFLGIRLWDFLFLGFTQLINTASQYILDYYQRPLGFLPGEPDPRSLFITVLLLQALAMFWLGNSVLKGKSGGLLFSGILLMTTGLLVDRFPAPRGVFLWLFSWFSLRAAGDKGRREFWKVPSAAFGIGIALLTGILTFVSWKEISPRLSPVLDRYYTSLRGIQSDLEEGVVNFFQNWRFGGWQGMVQNGVLTNHAPSGGSKTALTLTVEEEPEQTIYLKGFIGGLYQGSYWEEISEKDFREAVENLNSREDFQDTQEYWGYSELSYEDMQDYLAESAYHFQEMEGLVPEQFLITYQNTPGDYVYAPYFSRIQGDSLEMRGDVELLRNGAEQIQGSFYPQLPEVSGDTGYTTSLYVPEIIGYLEYLWNQYLYIPSSGIEELQSYWSNVLEEFQAERGHFPTIAETTTLIRETLASCSYSKSLDPLPEGEDFVQYFLFDQQKGFCTHFASAAVLLYRLTGYPARYATGYIADEFQENSQGGWTAEIPEENAHAWVEIFQNDGSGWIPVEMTPGYGNRETEGADMQPGISSGPGPEESADSSRQEQTGGTDTSRVETHLHAEIPDGLWSILFVLLTAGLILLVLWIRRMGHIWSRTRRFRNPNHRQAVGAVVREADQMLADSGFRAEEKISDQEYARQVQEAWPALKPDRFAWLIRQGEKAAFGKESISKRTAAQCIRIYRILDGEIRKNRKWWWRFWWYFIKCR